MAETEAQYEYNCTSVIFEPNFQCKLLQLHYLLNKCNGQPVIEPKCILFYSDNQIKGSYKTYRKDILLSEQKHFINEEMNMYMTGRDKMSL